MDWFLTLIILGVLIFIYISYRMKKSIGLVKENSVKLQKLFKFNDQFTFNKNVKKYIEIHHFVRTKEELSKVNFEELLKSDIKDNSSNMTLNLEYVMQNDKKNKTYLSRYEKLDDITPAEIISVTNMKMNNFLFLEKRLVKQYKLNPVVKTKVKIVAKYEGVKAKNKYQREQIFNYDELVNIYNKNEKE